MRKIIGVFIVALVFTFPYGYELLWADGQVTANQGYAGSDSWPVSLSAPVTLSSGVSLSGSVTLANQPITTHTDGTTQPVSMTSGVTLNSNVTLAGPVTFASGVTLNSNVTIASGNNVTITSLPNVTIASGSAVTVQPNSSVTVASANNVTITGALPTGSNGLGSVSITGPVTLSTGVTLSGSVTVASANNVTLTGPLPSGSNIIGYVYPYAISASKSVSATGTGATIIGVVPLNHFGFGISTIGGSGAVTAIGYYQFMSGLSTYGARVTLTQSGANAVSTIADTAVNGVDVGSVSISGIAASTTVTTYIRGAYY